MARARREQRSCQPRTADFCVPGSAVHAFCRIRCRTRSRFAATSRWLLRRRGRQEAQTSTKNLPAGTVVGANSHRQVRRLHADANASIGDRERVHVGAGSRASGSQPSEVAVDGLREGREVYAARGRTTRTTPLS